MCARPPVLRAVSMTRSIARSSAAGGREARKPAYARPCGQDSRASSSSACTIISAPSREVSPIASAKSGAGRCGNSSTPESSRKHLKPKTPASCSGARSPRFPGTAPPQKPTSTYVCPCAAACFSSSAATVVVGGMLLSGMSTIVVTPPGGRGPGRGGEALPLGAAGLVDVDVRVDQSREQHLVVGQVDDQVGVGAGAVRREVDDQAVLDADLDRLLAGADDRPRCADQDVEAVRLSCHGRWSSRTG